MLPFKYLGVPLSTKRLTMTQCKPLVYKITAKVTSQMARGLSHAGKLQFIRAALFGTQAYWSQLFLLPQKAIKLIEAGCRTYLGTGEVNVSKESPSGIGWSPATKSCRGVLKILNMKLCNQAAIVSYLLNQTSGPICNGNTKAVILDGEEDPQHEEVLAGHSKLPSTDHQRKVSYLGNI